jgi:peptidoglycan/LPS O-acetylase OafA/YrhL
MLCTAAVIAARSPFYRQLLRTDDSSRVSSLDGLRGYLAISVFICHGARYYSNFSPIEFWSVPLSRFYAHAAQAPVVLFFMITGFLFWSKAINGKIRFRSHYSRRFWRIMPLYSFLLVCALTVVAIKSGFLLRTPLARLLWQVMRLAMFHGVFDTPIINGVSVFLITAPAWTLRYECFFYLLLPLIAGFAKPLRFLVLCAAAAFIYKLVGDSPQLEAWIGSRDMWVIFLFGMATAHIVQRWPRSSGTSDRFLSGVALTTLVAVTLICREGAYSLRAYVLLFIAFVSIASGASLLGALTNSVARMLGAISYSIYLLHFGFLGLVFRLVNRVHPVASMSGAMYWSVVAIIGVMLVALCSVAYRLLEHPFLRGYPVRTASIPPQSELRRPSRLQLPAVTYESRA